MKLLKIDDPINNEKLIPWMEGYEQKLIQKESFFRRHRILTISFIVWLVFSALIFFTYLLFLLSDKTDTKNTVMPPCKENRVIGYYTGEREVTTEQLQKLTHIIFTYVTFDHDKALKFENETSRSRFLEMKKKAREINKDLKVMVSIGKSRDTVVFYPFWYTPLFMKNFVDAVVEFCTTYEIDGIELSLIYLRHEEKVQFLKFIQDIRKRFANLGKETPPLISFAVSPFKYVLADRYFWKDLVKEVDFINVLTYDYFKRNTFVGPTTPIFGGTGENLDSTMKYITCKTGNPQKLNLVIPTYGTYWTDVTSPFFMSCFDWITPERYIGPALYWSELEKNWVSFRIFKEFEKQLPGAEYHFHNESKSSYYWIPKSKSFITIEDEQSLREKVKYQNQMNIGGIGMMKIDYDDDENTLLNVLAAEKQCLTGKDYEIMYDCQNIDN